MNKEIRSRFRLTFNGSWDDLPSIDVGGYEFVYMYDSYMDADDEMYLDDLPFDCKSKEESFKVFIHLPRYIRFEGVLHGFNDTCFRDMVFEYLCKKLFSMTCEEYYASDIFKRYMLDNVVVEIDFNKLDGE